MDASGFWGSEHSGKIIFHKEPLRSSLFIKKEMWKQVSLLNLNLMLIHARQASHGAGEPAINKNNHPFVSYDRLTALIHNGRITDHEYNTLKTKYEVSSNCDSEILLRIFESGDKGKAVELFPDLDSGLAKSLIGLKDIFSLVNHGHMAVAIGQKQEKSSHLWLFRNIYRSLWVVDMREKLGQVFFCSTPDIWNEAIIDLNIGSGHKLIELPPNELWHFSVQENNHANTVQRFSIKKGKNISTWNYDGERLPINKNEIYPNIICVLDENEAMDDQNASFCDLQALKSRCEDLISVSKNIKTNIEINIKKGINQEQFNQWLEIVDTSVCKLQELLISMQE